LTTPPLLAAYATCPDHPVLRGDIDDAAPHLADRLLLDHLPHGALAAEEDAAEVDGHDRVPVLLLRLEQRLRITARDAGVVHHHVEPAAALYRRAHEPVEVVPARRVGLEELPAVAE